MRLWSLLAKRSAKGRAADRREAIMMLVVGLAGIGAGVALFANPGELPSDAAPTTFIADPQSWGGSGVGRVATDGLRIFATTTGAGLTGYAIYGDAYALTSSSAPDFAAGLDVSPLELLISGDLWIVSPIGVDRPSVRARYTHPDAGFTDAAYDREHDLLFASTSRGGAGLLLYPNAVASVAPDGVFDTPIPIADVAADSIALVSQAPPLFPIALTASGEAVVVVTPSEDGYDDAAVSTVAAGGDVVQVVVHGELAGQESAAVLVQSNTGGVGRLYTWADARALANGAAADAVIEVGTHPSRVVLDGEAHAYVIDSAYGSVLIVSNAYSEGAAVSATLGPASFASAYPTDLAIVE
jgi:hypothetical protein